jgi:uncharacterized membrane protein
MKNQQQKAHFQVERIAFFSDAVIAIAATLLIIEIKAPHIEHGASWDDQVHQLQHLIPEVIAFAISFSIIISQWIKHHEMFGSVINYDTKLLRLNSIFLFFNAITPFSTSYFAFNNVVEGNEINYLPYTVYGISLSALILSNFLIFNHLIDEKNGLYEHKLSPQLKKWSKIDNLVLPIALIAGLIGGYFHLFLGICVYTLITFFGFYANKQKKKSINV